MQATLNFDDFDINNMKRVKSTRRLMLIVLILSLFGWGYSLVQQYDLAQRNARQDAFMVEAVKELKTKNEKIEAQAAQIIALQDENAELKAKLKGALIPEATIGEAAKVHIGTPIVNAATATKDWTVEAYETAKTKTVAAWAAIRN